MQDSPVNHAMNWNLTVYIYTFPTVHAMSKAEKINMARKKQIRGVCCFNLEAQIEMGCYVNHNSTFTRAPMTAQKEVTLNNRDVRLL